jgi:hypothetical protein
MIAIWNKLGKEYRRVGHKSGIRISKTRVFGKFTDLWEDHTARKLCRNKKNPVFGKTGHVVMIIP